MAKVKRRRTAKNLDVNYVGHLPVWSEIESSTDEKFIDMMQASMRHYGYFREVKNLKKAVIQWMTDHDYSKTDVKAYKKSLDWRTPMTACSLAAAYGEGMPEYERATSYITEAIATAIASNVIDGVDVNELTQKEKDSVSKKYVPSIQDRITAKINDHILYIEETWEDDVIAGIEPGGDPDIRDYLMTNSVPPSMIGRIVEYFQTQANEIKGSQGVNADEQLQEAYSHLTKAHIKRLTDFYKSLIVDLEMYKEEKKVSRVPRARKAVSKSKQVSRLNYLKRHDGLKLVSINPEDIVDCKEIWVYQTKYRKLGKYVSQGHSTLGVKGTTIVGFDTNNSVQKTLRKPKEQLSAFKKAGKVTLRTFMDEVKAVDIKLTGRINKDTIILKAVL